MNLLVPLALLASTLSPLRITPERLFTHEDRGVLFTCRLHCPQDKCPTSVSLLQVAPSGRISARWELKDDGSLGDLRGGDHTYSRRVWFKKSRPQTLRFRTALSDEGKELTFVPRPTLWDILQNLFDRMK